MRRHLNYRRKEYYSMCILIVLISLINDNNIYFLKFFPKRDVTVMKLRITVHSTMAIISAI